MFINTLRAIAGVSRAPFLPLSALCALLGTVTGWPATAPFPITSALLAILAAVLAHASVNAFNEYADFRSGLDLHTERTPFSGGSGTLPASPEHARLALGWAIATLLMTSIIGLYFVWLRGWVLALPGLLGLLLVTGYTPWINRLPWLCLLAPGIGFGPLLVAGSSLAIYGNIPPPVIGPALLAGILVSSLLLANQQPDASVDARFGRRHLTIVRGEAFARRVLALLWLLPLPLLLATIASGLLPHSALAAAVPLVLAAANASTLLRLPPTTPLPPALLARNVIACLTTPLLLTLAIAGTHG